MSNTNDNERTANGDVPSTRAARKLATETPNRWIPRPEVRLWLYGVLVALAALAIGYGLLTAEQGGLWLAVFAAVLGVGPLVAARNTPR